jgi:hypothetical protein
VRAGAALVLLVACGGKTEDPPAPASPVTGKLLVAGAEQQIVSCEPGRTATQHTFVALATRVGSLRFENQMLHWSSDGTGKTRGDALTCEKLERSWWAGGDSPSTYYWLGSLAFRCRSSAGEITGDLELSCGKVTAEGRAQLDKQRDALRRQQAPAVP